MIRGEQFNGARILGKHPHKLARMSKPPISAKVVTADELLHLSLPDKQAELVRAHGLGVVVAAETGFILFEQLLRDVLEHLRVDVGTERCSELRLRR